MSKIMRWIGRGFAAVGFLLLIGSAVLFYRDQQFVARALRAEGRVSDLIIDRSSNSSGYRAIITFTDVNGKSHELIDSITSTPPRFSEGDTVTVLYDPQEPLNGVTDDLFGRWFGVGIILFLGVIFTIVGLVIAWFEARPRKRLQELQKNGVAVDASFKQVVINAAYSVNGRNPYQVVAEGKNPFTGKTQFFKSENLWEEPLDLVVGQKLRVLIHPKHPDRHMVDLSPAR
ncbi:DUF3592 domain-containing protein [Oryzifoliimicrobium ureilyticus]|uniref:DUF3592 domain-containing protein n=1 Tax=Oryzifoliimicrobium ureilyticus TaxID=3113724 RepID=UPI0030760399